MAVVRLDTHYLRHDRCDTRQGQIPEVAGAAAVQAFRLCHLHGTTMHEAEATLRSMLCLDDVRNLTCVSPLPSHAATRNHVA